MEGKNPSCMKCKHYFSSFNPQSPRGCRLFNFSSNKFPSMVVKEQTGAPCKGFEARKQAQKKGELDLNDPKLW